MELIITPEQKRKSGIYKITCKSDRRKIYIGSSADLLIRFYNHRSELRRGVHKNKYLQHQFNKHNDLIFEVLAVCPTENIIELEQLVLDEYKAGGIHIVLNINLSCERSRKGLRHSDETKAKISAKKRGVPTGRKGEKYSDELRKKLSLVHTGLPMPNKRKWIIQYDQNGRELNRFHGISIAAERVGTRPINITSCLKGRQKTAGSFKWSYA